MKTAYERWVDAQGSSEYWSELARLDFATTLNTKMEEQKVSRSDLAQKISVSKSYISKILGGYANFTIDSMSKLALALGYQIKINFSELDSTTSAFLGSWESVIYDSSPKIVYWKNDLSKKAELPRNITNSDNIQNTEKVAA